MVAGLAPVQGEDVEMHTGIRIAVCHKIVPAVYKSRLLNCLLRQATSMCRLTIIKTSEKVQLLIHRSPNHTGSGQDGQ